MGKCGEAAAPEIEALVAAVGDEHPLTGGAPVHIDGAEDLRGELLIKHRVQGVGEVDRLRGRLGLGNDGQA